MTHLNDTITNLNNSLKKVEIEFTLNQTIDSAFIDSFTYYSINEDDILTNSNRIGKLNNKDNAGVINITYKSINEISIKKIEVDMIYDSYYGTSNYEVKKYEDEYPISSVNRIDYIDYYNNVIDGAVERHIVFDLTSSIDGFIYNTYSYSITKEQKNNIFYLDLLLNKPIKISIYYYDSDYLYDLIQNKRPSLKFDSCFENCIDLNIRNGSFNLFRNIDQIDSTLDMFSLYLVYSKKNVNINTFFPTNFKLNYQEFLINNSSFYHYVDADFNIHKFIKTTNNVNNVYFDESGTGLILLIGNNHDSIIDEFDNEFRFNKLGLLIQKRFKHKNYFVNINLSYDTSNRLVSITHSKLNKTFTITYNDNNNSISINTNGFNTSLEKNINNTLYKVTGLSTTFYTYNNYGLSSILDNNGNKINLIYTETGKVKRIEEMVYKNNINTLKSIYDLVFYSDKTLVAYRGINTWYKFDDELLVSNIYETANDLPEFIVLKQFNSDMYREILPLINETGSLATFSFGGETSYVLTNLGLNSSNTLYSDTFNLSLYDESLICDNTYVFEVKLIISNNRKCKDRSNNINRYLKVELLDGDTLDVLTTVNPDANSNNELLVTAPFTPDVDVNKIKARIISRNLGGELKVVSAKVLYKEKETVLVSNIINNNPIIIDEHTMYLFSKPLYIEANMGSGIQADMSFTDLDYMIKSYIKDSQSFNVFYNNKRSLYYNIDNFRMYFQNGNHYDLNSSFEIGTYSDVWNTIKLGRRKYNHNKTIDIYEYGLIGRVVNDEIVYDYSYSNTFNQDFNGLINYVDEEDVKKTFIYNSYGLLEVSNFESLQDNTMQVKSISYNSNNTNISSESFLINEMEEYSINYIYNTNNLVTRVYDSDNSYKTISYDSKKRISSISTSINSVTNKNLLNYQNNLVLNYSNNTFNYNFTYDKYNLVSSIKMNNNDFYTFDNTININTLPDNRKVTYNNRSSFKTEIDNYGRLLKLIYSSSNNVREKELRNIFTSNINCDLSQITDPYDSLLLKNRSSKLVKQIEYDYTDSNLSNYILSEKYYHYHDYYGKVNYIVTSNKRLNRNYYEEYEYDLDLSIKKIYKGFLINNTKHVESEIDNVYIKYNDIDKALKETNLFVNGIWLSDQLSFDGFRRVNKNISAYGSYQNVKRIYYCDDPESNICLNRVRKITGNYGVDYEYEYTASGNIKSEKRIINNQNDSSRYYKYDGLNRLIREDNSKLAKTITYSYDSNGNILNKAFYNYTRNETLNNPLIIKEYRYDNNINDLLIDNGSIINYDSNLNITRIDDKCFEYSCNNLIIKYNEYSNNNVYYLYNYDSSKIRNRKVEVDDNLYIRIIHDYVYDNNGLLLYEYINKYDHDELVSEKEIKFLYSEIGLIGFIYDNNTYLYSRNLNNEIDYIYKLEDNGIYKECEYVYDAFGNISIINDINNIGSINPIRYKGYYYDEETGLYWLSSRYYDPEIGRFISPDSVDYLDPTSINGLNLYAYCNNDPVNLCDPSGHSAILIGLLIGAIVGAGIGFGTVAYTDYQDDGQLFNGSVKWYEYVGGTVTGAVLGAGVGGIIGSGGAVLTSAMSSAANKFISDVFAYSLTGTPFGTWEDYAVAFISGGLIKGFGMNGIVKTAYDVVLRPAINQVVKIGTNRTEKFNVEKYAYDIVTRGLTTFAPSPWKAFYRGGFRSMWDLYKRGYFYY